MKRFRFLLLLHFLSIIFLFQHSESEARESYPWAMFLPSIINSDSSSDTCADNELIAGRYLPTGTNCDIIKDTVTNLEWKRCSEGTTWNSGSKTCDGTNTGYSWYEANALAFADGWRVPTVTELRSLVYCSTGDPVLIGMDLYDTPCNGDFSRPTIVEEAFPNVPWVGNIITSHYWTSSSNDTDPDMAWVVSFYKGNVGDDGTKFTPWLSIRLVRTPQ